jgi:outer membrane biosynthesis protein TonB
MNRDSVLSVYSDARTEYTKQLCVFLVPAYFQFFVDLLEKAKQAMVNEPKKGLWQFQNYLNDIHDWNMERVNQEIHIIHTNSGCDYLEDLLTAVFIAHTKVLTAIRLSSHQKKVEINIPKVEHFLFKVLCETSKLLWSSTYLFRDGISGIEKQQNYRNIETILNDGVLQAVRSMVPVKSILKDFVNQDVTEEDSDDEPEKKDELTVPPAVSITAEEPIKELKEEPPVVPVVAPIEEKAVEEKPLEEKPAEQQTIIIDDKPTVRFGQFDAVFDSDHPNDSDMIYDPKEGEEEDTNEKDAPVLEIMEEGGISLMDGVDFDVLDAKNEDIGLEDYEELS